MRRPGYYWVKYTGEWIVCEWLESDWYFINAIGTTDDTAFDEIDERRIERSDKDIIDVIKANYPKESLPKYISDNFYLCKPDKS